MGLFRGLCFHDTQQNRHCVCEESPCYGLDFCRMNAVLKVVHVALQQQKYSWLVWDHLQAVSIDLYFFLIAPGSLVYNHGEPSASGDNFKMEKHLKNNKFPWQHDNNLTWKAIEYGWKQVSIPCVENFLLIKFNNLNI